MVEIQLREGKAVFEVKGWDKLWSFKSNLEILVEHIKSVYIDPNPAMGWFDGMKVGGTAIPYIFRAGTFYQQHELVFWDVRNAENTIVIELEHEHFKKLVIEVADPNA